MTRTSLGRVRVSTPDARTVGVIRVADTSTSRLVGLLADRVLADGDGLLLTPCGAVHTWFMRFPIDIVFLDRADAIVRLAPAVGAFRIVWGTWRAVTTIELPVGAIANAGLVEGMRLTIKRTA